jgi:hypothetical protein
MGTKVSNTGGSDFTPVPAGLHRAICIAYIDLGTQEGHKYQSTEVVWKPKVVIMFETPDELLEIDGEKKPYNVCKFYTKSLSPKATLTHDLESWRGKAFTAEELKGFDLDAILGAACQINVVQEVRNGKTYSNLANVLPLSKGMQKPVASIKPWRYDVYENFKKFPPELSEGFKNMILKCKEMSGGALNPTAAVDDFPDLEPTEDQIPF